MLEGVGGTRERERKEVYAGGAFIWAGSWNGTWAGWDSLQGRRAKPRQGQFVHSAEADGKMVAAAKWLTKNLQA